MGEVAKSKRTIVTGSKTHKKPMEISITLFGLGGGRGKIVKVSA